MQPDLYDGEAADDDPEVIAGMLRLSELRKQEREIPDLPTSLQRGHISA